MKPVLLILLAITLTGCDRPGDHPISENCVWHEEDNRSLNLATMADRRHLRYDAMTAEDLAIRWADRHAHLRPEYEQRRDECMSVLFSGVAQQHGVGIDTVRQLSRERDLLVDSPVVLSLAALYAFVAYVFAGRIRRRFGRDEPGFWVMTVAMAVGISLVGVMAGGLFSIVIEELRFNSGHLSYRMNRIPFRQHWVIVFVCGLIVFALATLVQFRRHSSHAE